MAKADPLHDRLIASTEVARHIYCARALGYDRHYPQERNLSLLAQLRRWLLTPWKSGSLILLLAILSWRIGIIPAILVFFVMFGLAIFILGLIQISQLPKTITIYHGTKAKRYQKKLIAPEFGLIGRLDYLMDGEEGYLIPILTKSCPAPIDHPHHAHNMQVIAHCLLLAENREQHPSYGVIRYGDHRIFEVDFDEESVELLSQTMDEIEANRKQDDLPDRNHEERQRCYACSHRQRCDQSLFG